MRMLMVVKLMNLNYFFSNLKKSTFDQMNSGQKIFLKNTAISIFLWILIADWLVIHNFLIENLAKASALAVEFFTGERPTIFCFNKPNGGGEILSNVKDSRGYVRIGSPCDAWELYYLGVAFIWVFPQGTWKRKLMYSLIILFVLYVTNILRVAGLFQISKDHPDWFHVFHKTIFQFVVYAIMFIVWIFYLRKAKPREFSAKA